MSAEIAMHMYNAILTFRVKHSRGEMYTGHGRLCVCMSVYLSVPRGIPTLLHGPGCNLGNGRGCPLVVHYWADLKSVHGLRCYDITHVCMLIVLYTANAYSAEREMSASACTSCMPVIVFVSMSVEIITNKQHMVVRD